MAQQWLIEAVYLRAKNLCPESQLNNLSIFIDVLLQETINKPGLVFLFISVLESHIKKLEESRFIDAITLGKAILFSVISSEKMFYDGRVYNEDYNDIAIGVSIHSSRQFIEDESEHLSRIDFCLKYQIKNAISFFKEITSPSAAVGLTNYIAQSLPLFEKENRNMLFGLFFQLQQKSDSFNVNTGSEISNFKTHLMMSSDSQSLGKLITQELPFLDGIRYSSKEFLGVLKHLSAINQRNQIRKYESACLITLLINNISNDFLNDGLKLQGIIKILPESLHDFFYEKNSICNQTLKGKMDIVKKFTSSEWFIKENGQELPILSECTRNIIHALLMELHADLRRCNKIIDDTINQTDIIDWTESFLDLIKDIQKSHPNMEFKSLRYPPNVHCG